MFYLKCGLWKENDIIIMFNINLQIFNILPRPSSISSSHASSISSSHPLQYRPLVPHPLQYPPLILFKILLSSSSISFPRPSFSSISSSHSLQYPLSSSSISYSHTLQYPPLILFNILLSSSSKSSSIFNIIPSALILFNILLSSSSISSSHTLQYPPLILINILLSPLQYPPILLFNILFSSSFIYLLIIYMKKKIVDFVCKFFLHPLSSLNTSLDTLFSFFLCMYKY